MQSSIDVFQDVVRYLDNHEEALRIKKLIFCLCKKYWENDPNILSGISLDDLVSELIQTKPSNEQLTFSVYKLVKTLNRPKVYAGVATIIIDQVSKLYNNITTDYDTQLLAVTAETVEREPPEKSPADLAPAIDRAVVYLENHRESSRIKKLLFATCKNRWENDPAAIDSYGLKNIILELQQNYPTITALKRALEKIVSNINKKALYVAVADTIVLNCEPLYDGEADYEDYGDGAADGSLKTQIVPLRERFDLPPRESFPNANDGDFSTSIVDFEESRPITELHLSDSTPLPSTVPHKEYDPFELRLEIFQFTNPLRVKILLYSILFTSWEQGGQDWVTLRHYTLEEMLEQLIQSGRSIKEIEAQLHDAARTQLDREANVQTAGTLVQALQRIF